PLTGAEALQGQQRVGTHGRPRGGREEAGVLRLNLNTTFTVLGERVPVKRLCCCSRLRGAREASSGGSVRMGRQIVDQQRAFRRAREVAWPSRSRCRRWARPSPRGCCPAG